MSEVRGLSFQVSSASCSTALSLPNALEGIELLRERRTTSAYFLTGSVPEPRSGLSRKTPLVRRSQALHERPSESALRKGYHTEPIACGSIAGFKPDRWGYFSSECTPEFPGCEVSSQQNQLGGTSSTGSKDPWLPCRRKTLVSAQPDVIAVL